LKTSVHRLDIELNSLETRKSKLIQEHGRLEQETTVRCSFWVWNKFILRKTNIFL